MSHAAKDTTLEVNGYATIVLEDAELEAVQALSAAAFGEGGGGGGGGGSSNSSGSKGFFSISHKKARAERATPDVGYRHVATESNPDDDEDGLASVSSTKEMLSYRKNHRTKTCIPQRMEHLFSNVYSMLEAKAVEEVQEMLCRAGHHSATLATLLDDPVANAKVGAISSSVLSVMTYVGVKSEEGEGGKEKKKKAAGGGSKQRGMLLCPAHEDRGVVTIIIGRAAGSELQVFDKEAAEWTSVEATLDNGTAVIITGNTLHRAVAIGDDAGAGAGVSNGAQHRVIGGVHGSGVVTTRESCVNNTQRTGPPWMVCAQGHW